jgi:hypothetical protein
MWNIRCIRHNLFGLLDSMSWKCTYTPLYTLMAWRCGHVLFLYEVFVVQVKMFINISAILRYVCKRSIIFFTLQFTLVPSFIS